MIVRIGLPEGIGMERWKGLGSAKVSISKGIVWVAPVGPFIERSGVKPSVERE
jgi:hypothetical protein